MEKYVCSICNLYSKTEFDLKYRIIDWNAPDIPYILSCFGFDAQILPLNSQITLSVSDAHVSGLRQCPIIQNRYYDENDQIMSTITVQTMNLSLPELQVEIYEDVRKLSAEEKERIAKQYDVVLDDEVISLIAVSGIENTKTSKKDNFSKLQQICILKSNTVYQFFYGEPVIVNVKLQNRYQSFTVDEIENLLDILYKKSVFTKDYFLLYVRSELAILQSIVAHRKVTTGFHPASSFIDEKSFQLLQEGIEQDTIDRLLFKLKIISDEPIKSIDSDQKKLVFSAHL